MPKGFDIVIDATGAASVFESCFHFVHMGSKIVAYGALTRTVVPVVPGRSGAAAMLPAEGLPPSPSLC